MLIGHEEQIIVSFAVTKDYVYVNGCRHSVKDCGAGRVI